MIAGSIFVTPHAVEQFRARIAPGLDYDRALGAIVRELSEHAVSVRPSIVGHSIVVRTRGGRYTFRAVVVGDQDGRAPAVVTILRSGH